MEGGGGDMQTAYGALDNMLKTYFLPVKLLHIDEYATYTEEYVKISPLFPFMLVANYSKVGWL